MAQFRIVLWAWADDPDVNADAVSQFIDWMLNDEGNSPALRFEVDELEQMEPEPS